MAYRDDIAALGADHHWPFDGNSNDIIASNNGTETGMANVNTEITEDANTCRGTNGLTDRVVLITAANINNSALAQKAVGGWFNTTALQAPPTRIYGEGSNDNTFQFVMAYGNNVLFEVKATGSEAIQIFGPVLKPDRPYHLLGLFEGTGFGNKVEFYVDGVLQELSEPVDTTPGIATLPSRSVGIFGDPNVTVGVGGNVILLQAARDGHYAHWATWDSGLTATQIREELFEKGALASTTITAGTQAAMQTQLDTLASSVRPDQPLNIRVETVTGDGDLTLTADNITHDALASIHVQYMGTGTLTWINNNGSDASIGSTPNGGTIDFVTPATLTVAPLIAGSEVRIYEAGTTTDIDGIEASGTSFQTTLTTASVDVVVHALGYLYIKIKAVDMTGGNVTLPVSQVVDRQYGNP